MQAFPEAAVDTLVLGGQVLMLDVALEPEPAVRVSYDGSGEGRNSPTMDAFFSRLVRGVAKGGENDGRRLRDALGYLMRLDRLATLEGNAGARWFGEVDALAKELAKFTQEEAAILAQCVALPFAICSISGGVSRYARTNERAHAKLTGLGDSRRSPSMFSCSVDTRWGFHTSTFRLSASWSISPHEPICLSNAALR